MNLANALANTFSGGYQALEKAGWRRGYAADCKSVRENPENLNDFIAVNGNSRFAKTAGHTINKPGISQTLSGWWLIPAAVIGAALWGRIIMAVL